MVRSVRQAQDKQNSPQAAKIRVRFPPSPTGIPHIGNTRTALFNYIFAKHNKGDFILRIEDTDQARLVPGAEEAIKEILKWLGLTPDEFYKQSERRQLYKKATEELLQKGLAKRDGEAVRFIVPKGKTVSWDDKVGNKDISFRSDDIEDFVILKSDGFPTYHLANVVDDHAMKISHVMRGDEWISSTPKHLLLYEAFGWKAPEFVHLPVILGPDKTKLSKRHGAQSVLDYRDEGYLKEALINYMALLGWNPGGDREIVSLDEIIEAFDLKDINTSSAVFDAQKLLWMNGVYIRKLTAKELEKKLLEFDPDVRKTIDTLPKDKEFLFDLAKTRMKTLADFKKLLSKSAERAYTDEEKIHAKNLYDFISKQEILTWDDLLSSLKTFAKEKDASMKEIYFLLTSQEQGLPLSELMSAYGKDYFLNNLKKNI